MLVVLYIRPYLRSKRKVFIMKGLVRDERLLHCE